MATKLWQLWPSCQIFCGYKTISLNYDYEKKIWCRSLIWRLHKTYWWYFCSQFLWFAQFAQQKNEKSDIKGSFFPILKTEKMSSQFFDILSGHPRETKRAQKGLVSSVSTRVMGIFLICLLLPTLLNKIIAFLNFLVWAFICNRFNGYMQNLGFVGEKTWIL